MSTHRAPILILVVILAMALAACNGNAPGERSESSEPTEVAPQRQKEAGAMKEIDAGLEPFAAEASSDLARRLEIDEAEIELAEAHFVTWRDSALGCPEPDMMYSQVLVPGYRVRLVANGNSYHYHGARDESPFHCPAERVSTPAADNATSQDRL